MNKVAISVIILTRNESGFIDRCLAGVDWADDVVVIDSESTDDTRERAAAHGARVFTVPWQGWVPQRQDGIARARHDWVFILEADEIVDASLAAAIKQALARQPDPRDGFNLDRRDRFFGVELPNQRNRARQRAFVRIFNRQHSRYNPNHLIHEEVLLPGRSIALAGTLVHCRNFTFNQQMHRYVDLAVEEAEQMERDGKRASAVKVLAWPVLRFFWVYLACSGWRLGGAGLVHAMMVAVAEYLRWATLWERNRLSAPAAQPATPGPAVDPAMVRQ